MGTNNQIGPKIPWIFHTLFPTGDHPTPSSVEHVWQTATSKNPHSILAEVFAPLSTQKCLEKGTRDRDWG